LACVLCGTRWEGDRDNVHQNRCNRALGTVCIDYDAIMSDEADESPLTQRFYRARSTEALGHALQAVRVTAGHTQTDLARTIGSSRPTISRMENGNPTTTDTVLDALTACGYELVVLPRGSHIRVTP
jgi:DNA-binding XRE family transcriptional regulator